MVNSYWWCVACRKEVDPTHVTFEERHEDCGYPVEVITPDEQSQLSTLKAQLAEAEECLRIYADVNDWECEDTGWHVVSARLMNVGPHPAEFYFAGKEKG